MLAAALMVALLAYVVFAVWTALPPPPFNAGSPAELIKTKPDRWRTVRITPGIARMTAKISAVSVSPTRVPQRGGKSAT